MDNVMQWGSIWLPAELWEHLLRYIPNASIIPVLQTCRAMREFGLARVWRPSAAPWAHGLRWACAFDFEHYWIAHFDPRTVGAWNEEALCNMKRTVMKYGSDAFMARVFRDLANVHQCNCTVALLDTCPAERLPKLMARLVQTQKPDTLLTYCMSKYLVRPLQCLLENHTSVFSMDELRILYLGYSVTCAATHVDDKVAIRNVLAKACQHVSPLPVRRRSKRLEKKRRLL
jgi:hypothetical protein